MTLARACSLLLFPTAWLLAGCGGGGGSSLPAQVKPSVVINWPARSRDLTGPAAALSVKVALQSTVNPSYNIEIDGDRPVAPAANQQSLTQTGKTALGIYNLTATFYSQAAEGGIVVATASTPVRLLSNGSLGQSNGSALPAIGFSSVVANVAVAPETVNVGSSVQLVATAKDAAGNLLALTPGSFIFALSGGSAAATISADGIVTGVAPGPAIATASVDSVFSDGATITVVPKPDFADSGFETATVTAGTWQGNVQGLPWSGPTGNNWGIANGPGSWGGAAHGGNQYAFIQQAAFISQTVTGLTVGHTYQVTFWAAARNGDVGANEPSPMSITANGTTILPTFTPTSVTWTQFTTQSFTATSGACTFMFKGQDPGYDASDILDDVHLVDISPNS